MKTKLPKTVYIKMDGDGKESWLSATERLKGHAEIGEKHMVGIYELSKIVEVTTEIRALPTSID